MTGLNQGKIIAVAGNQSTCADICTGLVRAGYSVRYLVHMDESHAPAIADYLNLSSLADELDIEIVRPATYAMNDEATRNHFKRLGIDLLVSAGWQRLFPQWFLDTLSIGAFGMHGSSKHLPQGRGRSPMNWSIIEGRDRFYTSLFRYDAGVDSGGIVGTQRFDITSLDTVQSVRHKNTVSQIRLLLEHLPGLLGGTAVIVPQPGDVAPSYYPKRTPDDGVIDWRDDAARIDRLVRGVSRPYPGAFTCCGDVRINIWAGHPFDSRLLFPDTAPGEVTACFRDGSFVVRCGDFSFFVSDWESPEGWDPEPGAYLASRKNGSWAKLDAMYEGQAEGRHHFSYHHYERFLESLVHGGYRCGFMDEDDGADGVVFLRHDVDKRLDLALEMAKMEHGRGIRSSYHFLMRGVLYNLMEPESNAVLEEIALLGHAVGLHCDLSRIPGGYGNIDAAVTSERALFQRIVPVPASRVVTFHNPPAEVVGRVPEAEYVSGYAPAFMMPGTKYISDSNAFWRKGEPFARLADRTWPRVQILVHPLWWMHDAEGAAVNVLAGTLRRRGREMDRYLLASNHLWKEYRGE